MPRTWLPLSLVAFMAAANAVFAGPPEGASGRMVLDEVADGLRRSSRATDDGKRIAYLERIAPTHDPRVAIFLGEMLSDPVLNHSGGLTGKRPL
jgi:hypothetical protein